MYSTQKRKEKIFDVIHTTVGNIVVNGFENLSDPKLEHIRFYGQGPYHITVIHSGPGVPGEMKPVALELSKRYYVLEPIQTKDTITGQIKELKQLLDKHGSPPFTLIDYSLGASLSILFTTSYPSHVRKRIIVSSGHIHESYVPEIDIIRRSLLSNDESKILDSLFSPLKDKSGNEKNLKFEEIAIILKKPIAFPK